jgi:hypothetical protein
MMEAHAMKREDFKFDHLDEEFEDYWFTVSGPTKEELALRYNDVDEIEVVGAVFSTSEDIYGVKRRFLCNSITDVVMQDDPELKAMLISLVSELRKG